MKRRRSKAKPIPGPVVVELQTPCGMPIGMKVYVAEDGTILDRPTTVAAEPADPGRARPSEQPLCGDVAVIRPADGFDYESIADASVASDMRSAAERIRQRTRAAYIETGRELSAIKTRLEHGSFVAWVERECEINIRTAQRMMAVVEFLAKNDSLSYLPPSTLSLLTARSTPVVEAVDALSGRIDAGERPSTKQVSALIAKA